MTPNGNISRCNRSVTPDYSRSVTFGKFAVRSIPLMGVGLVVAISSQMTDIRKLWGMLALEIVLGIAAIAVWLVKA